MTRPAIPESLRYHVVRVLREELDAGRAPAGTTVTVDDVARELERGWHRRYAGYLADAGRRKLVRTELYRLEELPTPDGPALARLDEDSPLRRSPKTEWTVLPYLYEALVGFEPPGCYKPCHACGLTGPHCPCDDETAWAAWDLARSTVEEFRDVRDTRRRAKRDYPR